MKRIASARERLASPWLNRPRRSSPESSTWNCPSQRRSVLHRTGHTRHISSKRSSQAQHLERSIPSTKLEIPRYDVRQQSHSTQDHPTPDLPTQSPALGAMAQPAAVANTTLPVWDHPEQEAEYAGHFYRVLEDGQPDQVMIAMTDPRSAGLVGSLPQTTFLEALHRLSPTHFVEPFRDIHHPLHSWSVLLSGVKRVEEYFDDFVRNLLTIVRFRTAAGQPLQLGEYTHLLKCARSMGNFPLAKQLWESMEDNRIAPDTTCYNYYMEVQVWDHCYTGPEAYRLRILPHHYRKRKYEGEQRAVGWQGFGTARMSVRASVMRLFQTMLDDGNLADERTYINLLIASARVGHNKGMRYILKTVWNIDLDAMKAQSVPDDASLPPATPYDPWSALYPTENLLFAVAHALGTNNDISGAVRVVQFISSSYNIPIPGKVWLELLERAYVLSRARTSKGERTIQANALGQVSVDLVRSMFDTMTSSPVNVTPTLQTWRFMMNLSIDCGSLEDCKAHLRGAYGLLRDTREKEREARKVVLRCLQPALDTAEKQIQNGAIQPDPILFQSPLLAQAVQEYDILRLQVYQQTYLLNRCLWVAARVHHWQDTPDKIWFLQERPKMLEEWQDFVPQVRRIFYDDNTGHMDTKGETRFRSRHWVSDADIIPVRRMTDQKELFFPTEERVLSEKAVWSRIKERYPYLDTELAPLNRLFHFEKPRTPEFEKNLEKFRSSWVEYPESSALSTKNNPNAGFYGRLAALGMLKTRERGIYLLDDGVWV
ncbi:hypothetical protein N7532_005554 [Penicillium argentinense]|uniref:Uncharacterized protein n=1 Tax=Penicillium argentinense TaxID=1131581 RepID=A0A9W9FE44_9EURO|nr:uncharacterized protein N7532_005554 [Penicillium argentinense]KAJ5098553.1 hypothetical protein N7532_005554 [Penicillium argentinense]